MSLDPKSAVMLIPSLEPDDRLPAYVERLKEKGFERFVIVDDGSSEKYQPIFSRLAEMDGVTVLHHEVNRGKGMGASGCVSWQFDKKGVIVINGEDLDEETVMMQALEAGAADFQVDENIFEVYTDPDDFDTVKEALKAEGLEFLEAEIQMVPQTYTALTNEDDIKNMEKMLEVMEANDDIQDVWHNWEE